MPTAAQASASGFFVDDAGNIQRANTRGEYGFADFYKKRQELTGTIATDYDWMKINRPDILKGDRSALRGRKFPRVDLLPQGGRDWGQGGETGPPDISGISNLRPSPGPAPSPGPTTPGGPLDVRGPSVHNLYNARIVEPPGTGVATPGSAAPSQSFAGGGGWVRPAGALGTGVGAMPRGSQFRSVTAGGGGLVPGMATGPQPLALGPGPAAPAPPPKGTFNARRPGMSGPALGRIREDLTDI